VETVLSSASRGRLNREPEGAAGKAAQQLAAQRGDLHETVPFPDRHGAAELGDVEPAAEKPGLVLGSVARLVVLDLRSVGERLTLAEPGVGSGDAGGSEEWCEPGEPSSDHAEALLGGMSHEHQRVDDLRRRVMERVHGAELEIDAVDPVRQVVDQLGRPAYLSARCE